jgi:hypothetical protein
MTAIMRCVKRIWSVGAFVIGEGKTSRIVGIASRMKTTVIREDRIVVRVLSKRRRFLS